MNTRQDISRNKLKSGLLRGAVVAGLVSGVAAASLGGVPKANATCVGISGINIGSGCDSTIGNFALVLGTGTATAHGLFTAAVAAFGSDPTRPTTGHFEWPRHRIAYAGGEGRWRPRSAPWPSPPRNAPTSSRRPAPLIPSIGNLAFNIGGSSPVVPGTNNGGTSLANRALAARGLATSQAIYSATSRTPQLEPSR